MQAFRYHVFVCDQKKPEGAPCCSARGSAAVIDALRAEVGSRGLDRDVQVTPCGSLGLCEHGPNMVVYPEGVWYSGVTLADIPEIVRSHFGSGRPVERLMHHDSALLRAEMEENKRKRAAALRARDEAGVLPDDLNERIRAFQESRVLLTAIVLDVFTAVGQGATAADIAAKIGADARATGMLLNALVSLDMLRKRDGVFTNTPVAARYFTEGSRDNARMALMHTVHLWARWSTLTEAVRTGTCVEPPGREDGGEEWTDAFIEAMHQGARLRARQVVNAVGAAGVRRMLDVGGGSGAYSIAFAQANPDLRADILDLASVVPIASRHIAEAGIGDRVTACPGDLRVGPLGRDYDLVLISSICHMLDEDENRDLLRRAFEALARGGRVVIQEFVLDPDRAGPRSATLFALNMLVGTRHGNAYTEAEYAGWLREAGFGAVQRVRLPGPSSLIVAGK